MQGTEGNLGSASVPTTTGFSVWYVMSKHNGSDDAEPRRPCPASSPWILGSWKGTYEPQNVSRLPTNFSLDGCHLEGFRHTQRWPPLGLWPQVPGLQKLLLPSSQCAEKAKINFNQCTHAGPVWTASSAYGLWVGTVTHHDPGLLS